MSNYGNQMKVSKLKVFNCGAIFKIYLKFFLKNINNFRRNEGHAESLKTKLFMLEFTFNVLLKDNHKIFGKAEGSVDKGK